MKINWLSVLSLILALSLGYGLIYEHQKIRALTQKVAELEYAQKMAEPKNVWLSDSITNLYTLGFNDYNARIAQNREHFLSETGFKAYEASLSEFKFLNKIAENDGVLSVKIKGLPQIGTIKEFSTAPFPDERIAGELITYQVPIGVRIQSGTTKELEMPLMLQVTTGKQDLNREYPNSDYRWIITDLKLEYGEKS